MLGFMFSTNTKQLRGGVCHFVSLTDAGGAAVEAGLKVGDRLIKVNDKSVLKMGHAAVVRLLQSAPPTLPLRLLVGDANDVIKESLQRKLSPNTKPNVFAFCFGADLWDTFQVRSKKGKLFKTTLGMYIKVYFFIRVRLYKIYR